MVTKNSHKIYPFLFSYSSFSFLLPFLYQTTHHARVKHTLFSDRQHLYEQVFEKRVNLICYDEVEDDVLEHRDGEGEEDEAGGHGGGSEVTFVTKTTEGEGRYPKQISTV